MAILLSLVLIGQAAAASPFRYSVRRDYCTLAGGAHGFGYLVLKIRVKELGKSGANYFRIISKVQYRNGSGWHTAKKYPVDYSSVFPNNGANYYHDLKRRYDPPGSPPNALAFRIKMRAQVWSNSLGKLDEKVIYGQKCVTGLP